MPSHLRRERPVGDEPERPGLGHEFPQPRGRGRCVGGQDEFTGELLQLPGEHGQPVGDGLRRHWRRQRRPVGHVRSSDALEDAFA